MSPSIKAWIRAMELTAPIERHPTRTLPVVIDELADRYGSATALVSPAASLSYRELAEDSRRISRWALAQGLAADDVVCLLMPNCPAYLAIWLGLTRIGVTVSLLNTHQRGAALAHSINLVAPRMILVGNALIPALRGAQEHINAAVPWWTDLSGDPDLPSLSEAIASISSERLADDDLPLPSLDDRALYIYTSGTTGLPKAAILSHRRIMQWSHWFAGLMGTSPADRMYDCLPLYHSVGGIVATGATLIGGGAVVLRERFSARDFWRDVADERCTLFQYIGELCRYLVNNPMQTDEKRHSLRLCCGNGLKADVWEAFRTRFAIPQIIEYYAATEGTFSLYNCEGKPGAIGRIPAFLAHRIPVALVKIDRDTGTPVRSPSGFCIPCDPGEIGEAVGRISDSNGQSRQAFEGYTDRNASTQKVLHDVFASGDQWYRSGDLMRQDKEGFFYFVDRVGDTYRWKGENVSTTEVNNVVSGAPSVIDAVTYGVKVPHADGRAGMCAIVVSADFDPLRFWHHLADRLPEYARPRFIRIVSAIEATETFKPKKQSLMLEGYDPASVSDPLYLYDRQKGAYVPLEAALHERVLSGHLTL